MLTGMRCWMVLVERHGGVGTWAICWSERSLSGSITVYRGGAVIEIGCAHLRWPGHMSCMVTADVSFGGPTVGIGINSGIASRKTPGHCIGGRGIGVGLAVGRWCSSRSGRGALGLQLLCITVSSLSLSPLVSARIWKGFLLCVAF